MTSLSQQPDHCPRLLKHNLGSLAHVQYRSLRLPVRALVNVSSIRTDVSSYHFPQRYHHHFHCRGTALSFPNLRNPFEVPKGNWLRLHLSVLPRVKTRPCHGFTAAARMACIEAIRGNLILSRERDGRGMMCFPRSYETHSVKRMDTLVDRIY